MGLGSALGAFPRVPAELQALHEANPDREVTPEEDARRGTAPGLRPVRLSVSALRR
jgi:hypothetical protein